jgi:hypothetical protein
MISEWILVFSFLVPANTNFNKPMLIDHFPTQEKCEASLFYLKKSYEEVNVTGSGYCWKVGGAE